jgi:hypothetical protein
MSPSDSMSFAGDTIDRRLEGLSQYRFRASFRLRGRERALVELSGMEAVRRAGVEVTERRLALAAPVNDGRQTPYGGHPVFVAQHATATCCRGCLARNHSIPGGAPLSAEERRCVVR